MGTWTISVDEPDQIVSVEELSFTPNVIYFNYLPLGETSEAQDFTITNSGTEPVSLASVASSNDEFTVTGPALPVVLVPGASQSFQVTFLPTRGGARVGFIEIVTGAGETHTTINMIGIGGNDGRVTLIDFLPTAVRDEVLDGLVPDVTTYFNEAIDHLDTIGGGTLRMGFSGKVVKTSDEVLVKAGINIVLDENRVEAHLNGGEKAAFRLRSGTILSSGHIKVISTGEPGRSSGIHSPVWIGQTYHDSSLPSLPTEISPNEGVNNISIRDLIVESDKWVLAGGRNVGTAGIQITGGAHDIVIDGLTVPSNGFMWAAVAIDWGLVSEDDVDGIWSSGQSRTESIGNNPATSAPWTDLENMQANVASFNAGKGWTTHPHHIAVRRVNCGPLTAPYQDVIDSGSCVVRVSGGYNITVEGVVADSCTYRAFNHTVGDLGFCFALESQRNMRARNIVFRNSLVHKIDDQDGVAVWSDSKADNVAASGLDWAAAGLVNPVHPTNILFENITAHGPKLSTGTSYGGRFIQQSGGTMRNCIFSGFTYNFDIDAEVYGAILERPQSFDSVGDGILVHHAASPPEDIVVIDPVIEGSGVLGTASDPIGLHIATSKRVHVRGGKYGNRVSEAHQKFGIRIATGAEKVTLTNPEFLNHAAGGGNLWNERLDAFITHRMYSPRVIYQSGVQISHTGTTDETLLATYTIPGGIMGANGQLVIDAVLGSNAGPNGKYIRFRANGTAFGLLTTQADASAQGMVRLANRGAENSQTGFSVGTSFTSGSDPNALAVDTSVDWTLTVHGILIDAADHVSLEAILLQVFPKE